MKERSTISGTALRSTSRRAFTLIELLVIVSIIAMLLTITMPGIVGLFTSGTDLQSRNVISGMLSAARAVAIANQSYAGVHVQIDRNDKRCWAAVMEYDKSSGSFVPSPDFPPKSMPGDMAFGEISGDYVTDNAGVGEYELTVDTDLPGFTTFNIIFGPDGSLFTGQINSSDPVIDTGALVFSGAEKQRIWNHPASLTLNERGVRAITAFHYKTFKILPGTDRRAWLEKNGQFLCINPYTGKLLPDEQ